MKRGRRARCGSLFSVALIVFAAGRCAADQAPDPQIGYVYPPSAAAGTTIDVVLGGYNWTPDMDLFVLDERVQLEATGPPGNMLASPPPYLEGTKAYYPQPMPREMPARFRIPADVPEGPVRWQAANANGSTLAGIFWVGGGREVTEEDNRSASKSLEPLPVTAIGRLFQNEEVDRYRIRADNTGPIACELFARRLGSPFHGVVAVYDAGGHRIADAADTQGHDTSLVFPAVAGESYEIAVSDIDFRGHRSFVYRLAIRQGPQVLAAIPVAGRRGETRRIEFVGIGIATGKPRLESVSRDVAFPANSDLAAIDYILQTDFGPAQSFRLPLGALAENVRQNDGALALTVPSAVTGAFDDASVEHRYRFEAKKDDRLRIEAAACVLGSPVDVTLAIRDAQGKIVGENDDLPGTSDAGLEVVAPADGTYEVVVGDVSGRGPSRAAIYRVTIDRARPDFALACPQRIGVPGGDKTELPLAVARSGGFAGPISVRIEGLPAGIKVPSELLVPADAAELKIPVECAADAATGAALIRVVGTAAIEGAAVERRAQAQAAGNLAARSNSGNAVSQILVAATLKPRVKIWPVESDERTVHRGSTHLAEIAIERLEGFAGQATIQMDSVQPHKFRRPIVGPDIPILPERDRVMFPVFVPEACETVDAYRVLLTADVEVPDPTGRVRHLLSRMPAPDDSIAITVEGALLKIEAPASVRVAQGVFEIPVSISRSAKFREPVRLEVVPPPELANCVKAEAVDVSAGERERVLRIVVENNPADGRHTLRVRAVGLTPADVPQLSEHQLCSPLDAEKTSFLREKLLPVISETDVEIAIRPGTVSARDQAGEPLGGE